MLNFEDCIRFANEHMICSVATCDEGQPRVRMLGMWFADQAGFYFSTTKTKQLYKQLTTSLKVEVCFYAPQKGPLGEEGSSAIGKMMRASGKVAFLDYPGLKQRLFDERPFLRKSAKNQVIFRIQNGEARFWTSEDSGRESTADIARF